jgi:hypothetical protein
VKEVGGEVEEGWRDGGRSVVGKYLYIYIYVDGMRWKVKRESRRVLTTALREDLGRYGFWMRTLCW